MLLYFLLSSAHWIQMPEWWIWAQSCSCSHLVITFQRILRAEEPAQTTYSLPANQMSKQRLDQHAGHTSSILNLKKMHWFKFFLHVAAAVSVVKPFQYLYKSRRKIMIDKKYIFASSWCNKHQINVYIDVCCVNVVKLSLFTHCFEVLPAVGCDGQICGTVQKKG